MLVSDLPKNRAIDERQGVVARYLESHGLGAVLLTRRDNFSWFADAENCVVLNDQVGFGGLLITRSGRFLVSSNNETARLLEEELGNASVETLEYPWHEPAAVEHLIRRVVGQGRVASDLPLTSWIEPLPDDFQLLQRGLSPHEFDTCRLLGRAVVDAVEGACAGCPPDATEQQLAASAAAVLLERGVRPTVLIAAAMPRAGRYRHPIPTQMTVESGAYLTVLGEARGLVVSCTRQFVFGFLEDALAKRHDACQLIQRRLMVKAHPGVPFSEIWRLIPSIYDEAGFPDEWRLHHQGGPTGYRPRDLLVMAQSVGTVQANQMFAWNPTVGPAKLEDTYIVTENGWEILTPPGGGWPSKTAAAQDSMICLPSILVRG